jgi:hypothetical protein
VSDGLADADRLGEKEAVDVEEADAPLVSDELDDDDRLGEKDAVVVVEAVAAAGERGRWRPRRRSSRGRRAGGDDEVTTGASTRSWT